MIKIPPMTFTLALTRERTPFRRNVFFWFFVTLFVLVWANSLFGTTDIHNWLLENTLVFIFLAVLILCGRKYVFSDLSYVLIFLFFCVHVYGSKYTYAENPLGFWIRDTFHMARNPYDRIVHFMFGFLLAYPLREVFLKWLKYPDWVAWWLPVEIVLSFGTLYELMEWAVADIFFKAQGAAYLGTQGDEWDAQKDIFVAIVGALLAVGILFCLKRWSREL